MSTDEEWNRPKVRICLHRGRSLVSRAIQWQTRSEYSHASLLLSCGGGVEAREGKGVIGARLWLDLAADGERVDIFDVAGLTLQQSIAVENFACRQIGKGYDWTMVLRFISRRQASRGSSGLWFCSELVYAAFLHAGVNLLRDCEPWEVSPGLLSCSPMLTHAT